MLSVALYELGFSNKQIAYWIGKRGAGQHTSAVYWRNEATESERLDAMKAIGQSNLPFRRTRAALARQADLEGANND